MISDACKAIISGFEALLGRFQPQLLAQMPEPAGVHGPSVKHELPQGGEAGFGEERRVADAPRSDLDQAAIQHGPGRRRQFGLALLRAGFPGAEKKTIGNLWAGAEVNPEFLAQPSALGWSEGGGRRLGGWAHAGKKGRPTATRKRLPRIRALLPSAPRFFHSARPKRQRTLANAVQPVEGAWQLDCRFPMFFGRSATKLRNNPETARVCSGALEQRPALTRLLPSKPRNERVVRLNPRLPRDKGCQACRGADITNRVSILSGGGSLQHVFGQTPMQQRGGSGELPASASAAGRSRI